VAKAEYQGLLKGRAMDGSNVSRRQFLKSSAAVTGAAIASTAAVGWAEDKPRTHADTVQLGKSGITLSRLGIGTGSNNGHDQANEGKENFTKLIHYAFDHGITYVDCARAYATFPWLGDAIKGLPREKLFIQSKVDGKPEDVLASIDEHRKAFNTDYVDSMLIHCMMRPGWTDEWKRIMEGFDKAQEKKWIRIKGVSCHTLPALTAATACDWNQVHLVRINPMGRFMDGKVEKWNGPDNVVQPVVDEIKAMHDKGRGIIGMKIYGNGTFKDPAEREKSVKFAMSNPHIDAVVIGMKDTKQVDEAIDRVNRALAAA
jgi:1-deoxyxylulose-5-phosphate synthase